MFGLTFVPFAPEHFSQMRVWLQNPEVARWWTDGAQTLLHLREELEGAQAGRDSGTRCYIIELERKPVGYIQSYTCENPTQRGIDLFIGENLWRYRGMGAIILKKFVAECVFNDPSVLACVVDPDPKNFAAIRAYEKAGFHRVNPEILVLPRQLAEQQPNVE